jgi:hypothetical protein
MAFIFGYNLSPHAEQILGTLLVYRGMTAKQLTALMNAPFQYNLSEEKSNYNYLRKLKNQGLVTAHKLQANVANGSIYYLTPKGYEYARDMMNIAEGSVGNGWIQHYRDFGEHSLGDLPYDLYVPPLKQPAHHLLLIDFFIQLNMIDEDAYEMISHRINLYAAKTYEIEGEKYRYRPDGEIIIGDKKFAIEIDRATESHEQLLQKMETYERYMDHCNANPKENIDKIDGIIFVVESKRRDHGIRRRWTNILAAFLKQLSKYQAHLNLIMTTIDTTQEALRFELKRRVYEQESGERVQSVLKDVGYSDVRRWQDTKTKEVLFSHGFNDKKYTVFFNAISQEFESRLYYRYLDFLNNRLTLANDPKIVKDIDKFDYAGLANIVFYARRKPFIVEGLSLYGVDSKLVKELNGLQNDIQFYDFDPNTSFSIFE